MYTATICHHSISRARTVTAKTLRAAKIAATKEFDGEFVFYDIVITDERGNVASRRRVDEKRWHDAS